MRDIYDLIKWAPTAMNSQPLRIVLIRTPEARARLLQHVFEGNKAKTASAPLVAVLAADLDFDELRRSFRSGPGRGVVLPTRSAASERPCSIHRSRSGTS